jgi:hypothetical protein
VTFGKSSGQSGKSILSSRDRIAGDDAISDEHALEFLLAFDGRVHLFERGYWAKFEVRRTEPTPERPHGLRYALTLHGPDGGRLIGFDNAHAVALRGSRFRKPPVEHDHWHRTGDDQGRPYPFTSVVQLLLDFEAEVTRVLREHGVSDNVIGEADAVARRSR